MTRENDGCGGCGGMSWKDRGSSERGTSWKDGRNSERGTGLKARGSGGRGGYHRRGGCLRR